MPGNSGYLLYCTAPKIRSFTYAFHPVATANLNAIKAVLASTAFAVAYRFANEYALYADSLARFNGGDDSAAFDHMVLMKVLPRIAGDSEMVKKIFAGLKGVLSSETESHKKMLEIEERDGEDLTFWP